MQVFPMDSIVTSIGANGLPVYDRPYTASDLRAWMQHFVSNGVFMDNNGLRVTAGSGMTVAVSPGSCHINGAVGYEEEQRVLIIQASNPTYDRIDTVVCRLNLNTEARNCELYVIQGSPAEAPVRPALTRNSSVYEIGIADVFVPAGASAFTQQRITDTRLETARCGAVTPFVTIDTTGIYEQLDDQVQKNIKLIQAAIDSTLAGKLNNFYVQNNTLFIPNVA